MASVDQGASQRRGLDSDLTPAGQITTLYPVGSYGQSYGGMPLGMVLAPEHGATQVRRRGQFGYTPIRLGVDVTPNTGLYYAPTSPGGVLGADHLVYVSRYKQDQVGELGIDQPAGVNRSRGVYASLSVPVTQLGGGVTAPVTTYKLRARDSSCLVTNPSRYVEWETTQTPLSVSSFSGVLPCGGPLVELVVLSIRVT